MTPALSMGVWARQDCSAAAAGSHARVDTSARIPPGASSPSPAPPIAAFCRRLCQAGPSGSCRPSETGAMCPCTAPRTVRPDSSLTRGSACSRALSQQITDTSVCIEGPMVVRRVRRGTIVCLDRAALCGTGPTAHYMRGEEQGPCKFLIVQGCLRRLPVGTDDRRTAARRVRAEGSGVFRIRLRRRVTARSS